MTESVERNMGDSVVFSGGLDTTIIAPFCRRRRLTSVRAVYLSFECHESL